MSLKDFIEPEKENFPDISYKKVTLTRVTEYQKYYDVSGKCPGEEKIIWQAYVPKKFSIEEGQTYSFYFSPGLHGGKKRFASFLQEETIVANEMRKGPFLYKSTERKTRSTPLDLNFKTLAKIFANMSGREFVSYFTGSGQPSEELTHLSQYYGDFRSVVQEQGLCLLLPYQTEMPDRKQTDPLLSVMEGSEALQRSIDMPPLIARLQYAWAHYTRVIQNDPSFKEVFALHAIKSRNLNTDIGKLVAYQKKAPITFIQRMLQDNLIEYLKAIRDPLSRVSPDTFEAVNNYINKKTSLSSKKKRHQFVKEQKPPLQKLFEELEYVTFRESLEEIPKVWKKYVAALQEKGSLSMEEETLSRAIQRLRFLNNFSPSKTAGPAVRRHHHQEKRQAVQQYKAAFSCLRPHF